MSKYTDNAMSPDPNHSWNKIIKLIPNQSVVLDIGCSSGSLGRELIKIKKCVVDGIEIDPQDARLASEKLRKVWVFSIEDAKGLQQIKTKYDVIIFADVLEHLVDPVSALRNLKRILNPGGEIIFSIPNMAHISVRLALLAGEFNYTQVGLLDKTHIHFYNLDEIKRIFSEAGLVVSRLDASFFPYPDRLVQEKLNHLGLEMTEKIKKMFNDTTATTYQYIGSAKFSKKKVEPAALSNTLQIENDVSVMSKILAAKEAELAAKEAELATKGSELATVLSARKNLELLNKQLENDLRGILNSKSFKTMKMLLRPYRRLYGMLLGSERKK